ncbi:MAG: CRISPR-associated endonuclease Cas1 [Leptolyngbyaceae cyanobacterium bins.59]|nr:CRISPR-associated endonuclease Cas1 [Leptolyngbyaceae cyanobacterium bins.59]
MLSGLAQFPTFINFQSAWKAVAANQGCPGVDGETIAQFSQSLDRALEALRRQVIDGTYHPLPLRQLWIPKKPEGWRELRVPAVRDRFVVQPPKDATIEIPIREVDRILVFGNIQLTNTVISTCLECQIPVIFLTQLGEYKGHLWSAEATDLLVETAQFQRHQENCFKQATAREIVQGKLWNSRQLLLRLNRKRQLPEVDETIAQLMQDAETVGLVPDTTSLDTLRGHEGAGAARYFAALNRLITNPAFTLQERAFHPPTDPMNSLLSFAYTLLFNNVFSLLLAEGLNPYLGNLHGAERPKAYLAFDLMEEFRSPIADTLVMKLVNQKIISPTDFTYPNREGGVYLEDPARRVFLKQFDDRLNEKISHPDVKESISYRRVIQLQVQRYKKAVLGNQPYQPFRRVI